MGINMTTWKGYVKKIGSVGAAAVGALPAVVPVVKAGQSLASGGSIETAVNDGLSPIGLSTTGSFDMNKAVKYGVFTAGCLGIMVVMRMALKKV